MKAILLNVLGFLLLGLFCYGFWHFAVVAKIAAMRDAMEGAAVIYKLGPWQIVLMGWRIYVGWLAILLMILATAFFAFYSAFPNKE